MWYRNGKGRGAMTIGLVPRWLKGYEKEASYMGEKLYDAEKYALELGFSEHYAEFAGRAGVDATTLRNVAKAKRARGLMRDQKGEVVGELPYSVSLNKGETPEQVPAVDLKKATEEVYEALENRVAPEPEPKKHQHYWRKDGTCACGAVRKIK